MITHPRLAALVAAIAMSALAAPVGAQTQMGERTYYQSGPWTVTEYRSQLCRLTHTGLPDGTFEVDKAGTTPAFFEYEPKQPRDYYAPSAGVEWWFDDVVIDGSFEIGRFYRIKDEHIRKRPQNAKAEEPFRRAERLTISHNGEVVLDLDLSGSLKAFDQLVQCAAQWPKAELLFAPALPPPPRKAPPVPPPPPPEAPPSRDQAQAELRERGLIPPPPPASRALTPIRPITWITPDDMAQVHPHFLDRPRRVGFTVQVNAKGRVDSCAVTSSSGEGSLDQKTCELITRRARFIPKTDAEGKPVPAQFSSVVVWQIPD